MDKADQRGMRNQRLYSMESKNAAIDYICSQFLNCRKEGISVMKRDLDISTLRVTYWLWNCPSGSRTKGEKEIISYDDIPNAMEMVIHMETCILKRLWKIPPEGRHANVPK